MGKGRNHPDVSSRCIPKQQLHPSQDGMILVLDAAREGTPGGKDSPVPLTWTRPGLVNPTNPHFCAHSDSSWWPSPVHAGLCREQGMLWLLGCLHRQVAPRELPDAPCQWEQAVSALPGGWEMLLS